LAAIIEIRSGAINWLRSLPATCVVVMPDLWPPRLVVCVVLFVIVCFYCIGSRFAFRSERLAAYSVLSVASLLVVVPLVKDPATFLFLAKDLSIDKKLSDAVLSILNSADWSSANLDSKKNLIRPLLPQIVAAGTAGNIGFWSAYCELIFYANTEAELKTAVTLLKYHINANLSAMTDFKLKIERNTDFCFRYATKQPVSRDNFELCVKASMDIMYGKSLDTFGKPPGIDFSVGPSDDLRTAWHKALEDCLNAKDPGVRARKCRAAAAVRSEFLFFFEADKSLKTS